MANKYLDSNGLLYLWSKIKAALPKKTSELDNDSGYITIKDVPDGVSASTTTPKMDGTAAVGTETAFARGDHVHPSDTTKVDKVSGKGLSTNDYTTTEKNKLAGIDEGANKTVVDSAMSSTSTNPVQNKAVYDSLATKVDKVSGKGLSTNDYTSDEKTKLAGIDEGANKTVVDAAMSSTSTNPVQNKAVNSALSNKVDKVDGKELSSNDYTDAEKTKLEGIEEKANNYTLPNATSSTLGGVKVGTNISVSNGTISVATGTTSAVGVVKLENAASASTTTAATPAAVKAVKDIADAKAAKATTLSGYGITDAYTKTEIDNKVSSALHYKGSKDTYADLPTTGNTTGDVWNVAEADTTHGVKAGDNVAWNGTEWDVLAGTVDLSAYMLTTDMVAVTNAEIDTIIANSTAS